MPVPCARTDCLTVVFGTSLTPVAADDFHYLGDQRHADLTPKFRRVSTSVQN